MVNFGSGVGVKNQELGFGFKNQCLDRRSERVDLCVCILEFSVEDVRFWVESL